MKEIHIFNMIQNKSSIFKASNLHQGTQNSQSINGGNHSVDLLCASATRYHNVCDLKVCVYKGESSG